MRTIVILLAAAALLAGVGYVLVGGDSTAPITPEGDVTHGEDVERPAEAAVVGSSREAVDQSQPEQRVSMGEELAHSIQVVDQSGAVQSGVRVYFANFGDARWNEHFAAMAEAPESLPATTALGSEFSTVTGLSGLAKIPDLPFTLAAARAEAGYGAVMVLPADQRSASEPLQLVLKQFSLATVTVVDAEGAPVEGVSVSFEVASAKRLASEGRVRGNPFGPWQVLDVAQATDAGGTTTVLTSAPESRLAAMRMPVATLECAVVIGHRSFGTAESAVPWRATGLVEFRLPASGFITVETVGFPDGTHPRLTRIGPEASATIEGFTLSNATIAASKQTSVGATSGYRFDAVPLHQQWRVDFGICLDGEESSPHLWAQSSYQGSELTGPSVPNEVVRERFVWLPRRTYSATLLGPDASKLNPVQFASVRVEFASRSQRLDDSVSDAGKAELQVEIPRGLQDEVDTLVFYADQSELRHHSAPLYATVAIPPDSIPPEQQHVDLGEVQLQELTQFFAVRVSDAENHAPVEGAVVSILGNRGQILRGTTDQGAAYFSPADFGLPFTALHSLEGLEIPQFDFLVEHEHYVSASVTADLGTGGVEVALRRSVALTGTAVMPPWLPAARLIFVESGKRLFDDGAAHSQQAFLRRNESGQCSFSIRADASMRWDAVVFLEGSYNLEIARISGVHQHGAAPSEDAQSDWTIDLSQLVDHIALTVLRPGGANWSEGGTARIEFQLMQVHPVGNLRARSATWLDGELHIAIGKDAPFSGELRIDGYEVVQLNRLHGGSHTIQLRAK